MHRSRTPKVGAAFCSTTLKLRFTLCITSTESLARGRVQLDSSRAPAPLDDPRRSIAVARSRPGGHLHQPGGLLQPPGFGGRGCDWARRSSHATAAAERYRAADPGAVLADYSGIDLRGTSDVLRPLASGAACVSDRFSRGRDVLRNQRHCRASRAAQTAFLVSQPSWLNSAHWPTSAGTAHAGFPFDAVATLACSGQALAPLMRARCFGMTQSGGHRIS